MELSHGVQARVERGVGWVDLEDPLLDGPRVAALEDALGRLAGDPGCRVIVVNGARPDFCRGLDLQAVTSSAVGVVPLRSFAGCLLRLCEASQPTVAAVQGMAQGGGVGLASACDLVLAAPGASFMLPEVIFGLLPELVAPFVVRRLGTARARYLALSSRGLDAGEAQRIGLVDEVAADGLEHALRTQLRRLLRSSPRALAECKRRLQAPPLDELRAQAATAIVRQLDWLTQAGGLEGVEAFVRGERPPWFPAGRA